MPELIHRFRSFDAKLTRDADNKRAKLRITASSNEPISWGDWREVLCHDAEAVDISSARALLINHKSGMLAGPISNISFNGRTSDLDAEILEDARMESGVSVQDAVDSGALRGVSIGYGYRTEDTEWDPDTRTLTVRRWTLREASLTPIPADITAQVRSLPDGISAQRTIPMTDPVKPEPAAPAPDADKIRADAVKARDAEIKTITDMAESLSLRASEFLGKSLVEAQADMLRAVAKRESPKTPEPMQPATPGIRIGVEHTDKQRACVEDTFVARVTGKTKLDGNPYAGRSMLEQARLYARQLGIRGSEDWSRKDLAHFALGSVDQIRDASGSGNIGNASFPSFVTLNAITKAIAAGFEMSASTIQYQRLVQTQRVPDFKTFYVGGLGTANLQETVEGTAFPELDKAEGVYSDTVKMWGGTLSLSLQALLNDDTNSFDRSLRSAGLQAQKAIDKRVFQKLMMGTSSSTGTSTWTSNTTSGCSPVYSTMDTVAAARGNVGKSNAALMQKIGLDGNPTGNRAKYFVAGPTSGLYLSGLLQGVPGQTIGNSYMGELIVTPWLEFSALTGYSTTSYYAVSDPAEATSLLVSMINGYESPQVWEYDAGSVAARKWKTFMPFEADLFYFTNAAGTAIIPGAQQATT